MASASEDSPARVGPIFLPKQSLTSSQDFSKIIFQNGAETIDKSLLFPAEKAYTGGG